MTYSNTTEPKVVRTSYTIRKSTGHANETYVQSQPYNTLPNVEVRKGSHIKPPVSE